MVNKTRRIETLVNTDGQSVFSRDEMIEEFSPSLDIPEFTVRNLFYTEDNPISLKTEHCASPYELMLPFKAFRFLLCKLPPIDVIIESMRKNGVEIPEKIEDLSMHQTPSVDYLFVNSGEVELILDSGERHLLKKGDFIVQRGTMHSWVNHGSEDCEMLCVMLGVEEADN